MSSTPGNVPDGSGDRMWACSFALAHALCGAHEREDPAEVGDQVAYLNAFLDERVRVMKLEAPRVDDAQRVFLAAGNLNLDTPLTWKVYGDSYDIP